MLLAVARLQTKGGYKNIALETIITLDRHGQSVVRGNRGYKSKLRTAVTRMRRVAGVSKEIDWHNQASDDGYFLLQIMRFQ